MPTAAQGFPSQDLQIRLLGELQVCRLRQPLLLPASRKTRALLAYLAVTARRHLRSELCALFFEDAADPRAGLRWSLTQIRRVLGERDREVIGADRESVELRVQLVSTDLARLDSLMERPGGGSAGVPAKALREASALFRGEFLEGLDLPSCYAYHEWCMSEREAASRRHEQILLDLVERHGDDPEQALLHARALAAHNPLNERGHIQLMEALGRLGRRRDALEQYEQCCRIFERELGLGPPPALEVARAQLNRVPDKGGPESAPSVSPGNGSAGAGNARPPLVGRVDEVAQLARSIELATIARQADVVLMRGVPGIGKSRLLDEVESRIARAGGCSLRGRAFEAEMLRPFGFWIDALRALRDSDLPAAMQAALRPLTRAGAGQVMAGDRDSLFDTVLVALRHLAKSGPVGVLVDDLHWIEASSAALLHYSMRQLAGTPVLFVFTGRTGELEDNASAQTLITALAQSGRLQRIALGPLSDDEARALVGGVAPVIGVINTERLVAQAQGNPLILLELARWQGKAGETGTAAKAGEAEAAGEAGLFTALLEHLRETRSARLSPAAAELLDWASAFGPVFSLEVLIAAYGVGPGVAGQQLAELERHELIRAVGDAGYAFSHDLVQQAVYSRVSQPRRRLMHTSIARALSLEIDARPQTCSELAYHAGRGGQHELAARASTLAGEHALRVFANREAAEVARRGRLHAARIADQAVRAHFAMALLRVQVLATSGPQLARLRPSVGVLGEAIAAARAYRLHAEVAQGCYLLSVVYQEAGSFDAAQQATLQAAQASDRSDALGRARQLANSARCLVELGRDVAHARELVAEARTLADGSGLHEIEVRWCTGLLHHWDGDLDAAVREIDVAIELASEAEDRWRQCKCLAGVAMIELERRRPQQALARAADLRLAASQLGEVADEPLAQAIEALAAQMSGEEAAPVDAAIAQLRAADDKSRLAGVLNLAAAIEVERQRYATAGTLAADALAMAESIGESNESALARATLLAVAVALGDRQRVLAELEELRPVLAAPRVFSARAASAALAASLAADPGNAAAFRRAQRVRLVK